MIVRAATMERALGEYRSHHTDLGSAVVLHCQYVAPGQFYVTEGADVPATVHHLR